MAISEITDLSLYTPEQRSWASCLSYGMGALTAIAALYTSRHGLSRPIRPLLFGGLSASALYLGYRIGAFDLHPLNEGILTEVKSFTMGKDSVGNPQIGVRYQHDSLPAGRLTLHSNGQQLTSVLGSPWLDQLIGPFDGTLVGYSGNHLKRFFPTGKTRELSVASDFRFSALCYDVASDTLFAGTQTGELLIESAKLYAQGKAPSQEPITWASYDAEADQCFFSNTKVVIGMKRKDAPRRLFDLSKEPIWLDTQHRKLFAFQSKEDSTSQFTVWDIDTDKGQPASIQPSPKLSDKITLTSGHLCYVDTQRGLHIYDPKTGHTRVFPQLNSSVDHLAYDAKRNLMIASGITGAIQIWNLADQKVVGEAPDLALNVEGCQLAVDFEEGTITQGGLDKGTLHFRRLAY
ncbi:MAG: hypothetical protein AB7F31_02365 [Parachlamydiales bacterium]